MESQLINRITINSEICHGKPTIRNKRYTVDLILDLLSAGSTYAEILEDYPNLVEENILACKAYSLIGNRELINTISNLKISTTP